MKLSNQHVAYQTLNNGLSNKRVSHSYLFYGGSAAVKCAYAIALAKAIIVGSKTLDVKETTDTLRIEQGKYNDLIYLNGRDQTIKKEDIQHIIEQFTLTALERYGQKVYIIEGVEYTSLSGLNSLLKFLEEPSSDVTAILIVDSIDKLLNTIVSRCQLIPFVHASAKEIYQQYIDAKVDAFDAYVLAHITHDFDLRILEEESYQIGLMMFKRFMECGFEQLDYFEVITFHEILDRNEKQKEIDLKAIRWFLDVTILCLKDISSDKNPSLGWYNDMCKPIQVSNVSDTILVLLETKDLLNKVYDYRLVFDQMIYKLKGVQNGRDCI